LVPKSTLKPRPAKLWRGSRDLERLSEARGLDPVFLQELNEAAEIGDTQRFFAAVGYILAALKESREQAKLEAS
jgi:hypothetical protein